MRPTVHNHRRFSPWVNGTALYGPPHVYESALIAQSDAFNATYPHIYTPGVDPRAFSAAAPALHGRQEASSRLLQFSQEASLYRTTQPQALQDNGIDLERLPPLQPVTIAAQYFQHGIIKIKNIPFTISAQEIAQFVNKFAVVSMVPKTHESYPIHIIMEKPTGKTMDCFVEFPNTQAARDCARRFDDASHAARNSKLGTRNVDMELSNQAELMKAVFPLARLVDFDLATGEPRILSSSHDRNWSSGFRGYFTLEETYGLTRFAENPSRSPFVLKCHQRVYECMISTLYKFPWPATSTFTVAARDALFESAYRQLKILNRKVGCPVGPAADTNLVLCNKQHGSLTSTGNSFPFDRSQAHMHSREVGLSQSLLSDLLFASVNVPAFSLLQKRALCETVESRGWSINVSSFIDTWPFQTLEPTPDTPDQVTKFWLDLFHKGFECMQHEGLETTFEQLIVFTRNAFGLPIAEWTRQGVVLPFDNAIRVETAAMMTYVIRGRAAFAAERQIFIQHWQPETIADLIEALTLEGLIEHENNDDALQDQSTSEPPSPRTMNSDTQKRAEELGPVGGPSPDKQGRRDGKLNPATVQEFVPSNSYNSIASASTIHKDDIQRPFSSCIELGAPHPIVVRQFPPIHNVRVNTSIANLFRDPFAVSLSKNDRIKVREHSTDNAISPRDIANSDSSQNLTTSQPPTHQPSEVVLSGVTRPNSFSTIPTGPEHASFTPDTLSTKGHTTVASTASSSTNRGSSSFSSGSIVHHNPSSFSRVNDVFASTSQASFNPQEISRRATANPIDLGPIGSRLPAASTSSTTITYGTIPGQAHSPPSIAAHTFRPANDEHEENRSIKRVTRVDPARTWSVQESSLRRAGKASGGNDQTGLVTSGSDGVAVTRAGSWTGAFSDSIWGGFGLGPSSRK